MTDIGSIRVEGADELRKSFSRFADGTENLKRVHADAAKVVEKEAKPRARKRSGKMSNSVRSTGQARQAVVRAGFASTPWVPVQHFGWPGHNISPNPFLYEALDSRADEVVKAYEDGIMKMAKDAGLL